MIWQYIIPLIIFMAALDNVTLQANDTTYASLSLEEMVSGFRFQQLQLSTTMMNASIHARLPEKLASAEAQEADQREAKAFRAFHEAQTPFIATTSLYNLGYIGRGYDLFKGNPLSDDGVVDQGFRLPIMELPYTHKFTADGEYRIPDNVDVIAESSAKFGSSFYSVQSESDYKRMLSVDASVNAARGGWGVSASFSASASYQKNTREIHKGETTTLNIVSRAVAYRARMSETAKMSKVNEYVEKAVMLLPMENCEDESLQEMYLNFIREFGTHYTTQVVMGAKAVQQLTFDKSDLSRLESEGISAKVAAQASFSGLGASGGGGFSVGVGSKEESKERVQNTNKEQYEYYIGGNPPSGDFSLGSTESLREWARSADEKPVPIQYRLTSIETLLKPGYFKDITYGLFERRQCLRRALYTYCKSTASPSLCNPPDGASTTLTSRRKRQAEDVKRFNDGIKFGDFVTLRNRNSTKYLALSTSTGYLYGTVTKPLVQVDSITNYDGLFQIKSGDDDSTTLGTPLVYGQSFKLVSVEAGNLFTGRLFIDDISRAPTSKLETLFKRQDGRKFSAPGDITDFSIFQRLEKDRSYVISLQINCSGRDNPPQYQVNLEGTAGTAKFEMDNLCKGGYYGRTSWYHGAFADKDIGQLQRVRLMGRGTEPIKGIQILIGQGRDILRHIATGLSSIGYEYRFDMGTAERKPVEIDIYPALFSFHSKTHPAGSVVRRRDTVFIEVVSAVDRKSFWGQPVSHLLSNKNGMVTIKEKGPVPHKAKRGCSGIIFPDNGILGVFNNFENRYFVSFGVDVMITTISIRTKRSYLANQYSVEYIDRNSPDFQTLQHITRRPTSGNVNNMEITFPQMYLSAIQVYVKGVADFADNVNSLLIRGCPSALVEAEPHSTDAEEWDLRLSENQVQTYPYLRVVPTQYNVSNFDKVFQELEKPFSSTNYRKVIDFEPNQRGCVVDQNYIQNYLMITDEIEGLKFRNTRVKSSGISVTIITDVMAINKIMYEQNMPAVDSLLRMAVQRYPCNSRDVIFSLQPSLEEGAGLSTTVIAVITSLALLDVATIAILIIVCVIRRKRGTTVDRPDRQPTTKKNINIEEGENHEYMYPNRSFEDTRLQPQAPPAIPSQQRRMT
ncbi:uncharacterized protein LOC134263170 [Saccostrea cucullata]|uniref:uncharacterized protein LOC134263170 n=1 Tax=Saccostrea cuccullata TaxID=36930 RepID=UPI002ED07E5F